MNVNVNNRAAMKTADQLLRGFEGTSPAPRRPKPAGGEDARILRDVLNALHWDLAVPRHRIAVSVEHGLVFLRGEVDHAYSRALAEADARSVCGVIRVDNAIVLSAVGRVEPSEGSGRRSIG